MANHRTIPYVQAVCMAEDNGLLPQFLRDFGSEETCPRTGTRVRISSAQYTAWSKAQA